MPCILKVRVVGARDLPIMDRTSELADAYVELRFADFPVQRTQVCRKTLSPVWNEDFRFEVSDDADLQNEPLELKVMDYDAITADDAVGAVIVDLNPLLAAAAGAQPLQLSGWLPLYDTLRGVRGALQVQVRLQFFGDVNPFKDSSAGVRFFTTASLPSTSGLWNSTSALLEDLESNLYTNGTVQNPAVYNISTPVAQHLNFNQGTQSLESSVVAPSPAIKIIGLVDVVTHGNDRDYEFFRTSRSSNEARQRLLFRLSGQLRRLVGRKILEMGGNAVLGYRQAFDLEEHAIIGRAIGTSCILSVNLFFGASPTSESFVESLSNKEGKSESKESASVSSNTSSSSLTTNDDQALTATRKPKPPVPEQVFLTLENVPFNAHIILGGLVSARSVKLLEHDVDRGARDSWWTEVRDEIKSHAKSLACSHIIGYNESTTISDDLIVLSAIGTACVMETTLSTCSFCHIPYSRKQTPFPMSFSKCGVCRKRYVPEVLLATVDPPPRLQLIGSGYYIQSHVCRAKKRKEGENNANNVGESLPFVEYDIHRQLMYKLRVQGLNAIFGLRYTVTVGDALLVAVASGTAYFLPSLPTPGPIQITRNLQILDDEDKHLASIQNQIMRQSISNRAAIEAAQAADEALHSESETDSDGGSSDSDSERDDTAKVVVQIDDDADEDLMAVLLDPPFLGGVLMCNLANIPRKLNSLFSVANLVTVVKQSPISMISHHPNRQLSSIFQALYAEIHSSVTPNSLIAGIQCDVQLPREYDVQICINATILQTTKSMKDFSDALESAVSEPPVLENISNDEDLVKLLTDAICGSSVNSSMPADENDNDSINAEPIATVTINALDVSKSSLDLQFGPTQLSSLVNVTTLSFLPNSRVQQYLGKLSMHFVKEVNNVVNGGRNHSDCLYELLLEVLSIVRAHVAALGGNSLLSYRIEHASFAENKGDLLMSISGDAAILEES